MNGKVGLALFFPVTSQKKCYSFEVALPSGGKITGLVLADQVRSLDWRARKAEFIEHLQDSVIQDVLAKLATLIS